jgi:hypothetical protein
MVVGQITADPPTQAPPWQVSPALHPLPSLHAVPSAFDVYTHSPVAGLQFPASWHASGALHGTDADPVHAPAWQVSVCVHAFPSLHVVPSGFGGCVQLPVDGSHVPASRHWFGEKMQIVWLAPRHAPPMQRSPAVQRLPSSHGV